jgi:hypothetical protein
MSRIPEKCICRSIGKTPMIRRQASLTAGVVEEIVCFSCDAWYPTVRCTE